MSSWTLSTDPKRLELARVHAWLCGSYWSPNIRLDVVERAFANSLVVGAYDEHGAQVGVARAVTDQATFAWLCDVFVDQSWRGRGLAKVMVTTLIDDPRLQTLRRWCLATRDAHEIYRALGFRDIDATKWMELLPAPAHWQR
jgi:GNAT superfamily N-acetyltransferase